jgi:hypothetical protein
VHLLVRSKLDFKHFQFLVIFVTEKYKMSTSTKLVEKLEGIDNFRAWKYRIGLILAENDLSRFIKEEVEEPEDAVEKAKHQKDSIRAQRIITDSIKDHLIPYVSSKKTLKEMFDALRKLYEGKNIN